MEFCNKLPEILPEIEDLAREPRGGKTPTEYRVFWIRSLENSTSKITSLKNLIVTSSMSSHHPENRML